MRLQLVGKEDNICRIGGERKGGAGGAAVVKDEKRLEKPEILQRK